MRGSVDAVGRARDHGAAIRTDARGEVGGDVLAVGSRGAGSDDRHRRRAPRVDGSPHPDRHGRVCTEVVQTLRPVGRSRRDQHRPDAVRRPQGPEDRVAVQARPPPSPRVARGQPVELPDRSRHRAGDGVERDSRAERTDQRTGVGIARFGDVRPRDAGVHLRGRLVIETVAERSERISDRCRGEVVIRHEAIPFFR